MSFTKIAASTVLNKVAAPKPQSANIGVRPGYPQGSTDYVEMNRPNAYFSQLLNNVNGRSISNLNDDSPEVAVHSQQAFMNDNGVGVGQPYTMDKLLQSRRREAGYKADKFNYRKGRIDPKKREALIQYYMDRGAENHADFQKGNLLNKDPRRGTRVKFPAILDKDPRRNNMIREGGSMASLTNQNKNTNIG